MKPAALRLAVTAVLFAGWVGYLGYLAAMTRNPVVLSRPQFLVSDVDVVATRQGGDSFLVAEVLYPPARKEELQGKTIVVQNIDKCQIYSPKEGGQPVPPDEGRSYLLPLRAAPNSARDDGGAKFEVVPIPPSPGYPSSDLQRVGPPRVYPAGPEVLSQYRSIPKS